MNKGANRHGGGGPLIGYSSSQRRQIMASLRRCFRVLGLKRDNPGTGALGQGCVRLAGIALVVLSPTLYILAGASEALGQTIPRDGWNYQWSFTTMTADVAPIVTSTMQTTAPQQGSTSTTVQGANPNPTSQGSTLSAANPGNIILTINTDQSAPAGSNDVLTLQGTVNDPNEGTPRYRNFFTGYVDSTTSLTNVIIGDRWGDPNNLSKTIINGGILQFGNGASVNTGGAIGIGVASKSGAAPNASGGGRGVAIGTESNAMTTGGSSPVAIGWGANAQGGGSQIAIGDQSAATGFNSVALGGNAGAPATAATGSYALAIGPSTKATAENTVSMGRTAMASAADAIAIGGNATAGANASASGAVAIGAQTTASAANGVAIGNGASISSTGTDTNVAMGANSTADGSTLSASAYNPGSAILAGISPVGEVSIGSSRKERRMTNVAAGANATDAVNVSQLTSLDTKVDNQGNGIATVIGGGSSYDPAIGKLNTPTDIGGTGKDNINDAIAAANAAANTGWNLQANGDTASQVKPGDTVQFTDGHNIAITRNGEKLTVSTTPDLAADSLTAGNTKIDTNGLTIMGGPSVLASGIDAGGKKITDVAAGDLTATSADAVNGSQLFITNQTVTTVNNNLNTLGDNTATVIGGGSTYNPATGTLTTPTDIGGTGKDNINDAIAAANAAANTGWNLQANGDTASQVKPGDTVQFTDGHNIAITRNGEKLTVSTTPDLAADSLTAGNTKIDTNGLTIMGGPSVLASGIDAGGKKITDVAAGDLTATSADAVNGSQLFITNQTVTTVNNNLNTLGDNTATVIGGGSTYNPATGTLTTPTDIGGTGKDNINDAIAAANAAANTGWNLQANGDTASQVKPGDTVQFTDGHNIAITRNGEKLTVSTTPNLTADSLTAGNTKIDTNGLTIMGGPSVLASGIDAGGKKITDVAAGDLTATSADAVNGSQLFTTNEWLMTLGNQLNGAGGFGQTMQSVLGGNAHYDTTTGGMTMSNIGGTGKDNINDAIQAANTAASAGWNLQANGDTASQVKPGDTVQFTNGQNIAITRNGENLTIATAPDLTANSLTAGNTTINNSGLTIQNGPSVTSSGIDAGGQKVTNVADGTVAAGSKDAVNGGQLHNTANSVASALGGGSKVNSDGTVSAPSYTVQGNTYNNVGSALGAVDSNITNLGTTVNSIGGDVTALKNGTAGVVQRSGENGTVLTAPGGTGANPGAAQTLGNVADGEVNGTSKQAVNGSQLYDTNQQLADVEKTAGNSVQYDTNPNGTRANTVTLQGGDANAPVVLKNVGTGTDDTDAVNVKQLKDGNAQTLASANTYTDTKTEWAVDQSKAYTDTTAGNTLKSANAYTDQKFDALDQQMGNLSSQIGDVRKEARQAAAIGLAAASLRYDDRPGKLSAAISGGYWRDQGAFAFGVGYTSESGRLRANISGTTAGGHVGAGAGLSYTFN